LPCSSQPTTTTRIPAMTALAALVPWALDGIPESIALGVSLLSGVTGGLLLLLGIFISNFPEGMSGATGMTRVGMSRARVLGMWASVAVLSAVGSSAGFLLFTHGSRPIAEAMAAGAIMAMLADTMMPEAFSLTGNWVALATAVGFIAAFWLSKLL
jgi:ZIP family zinc transporter